MHPHYHPFLLKAQLWTKLTLILLYCILTHSLPSRQPTPATDQLALLSFKGLISDDPSGALSSWNRNNQTLQFCRWEGVTCGTARHPQCVTALDLPSLNLTGTISPFLANLTFLRILNLPNNHLYGLIPQELGNLRHLQFLNLSFNSLEGDFPPSLTRCSSIRVIFLRSNNLGGEIPANLSQCRQLRLLSFSTNQLVGTIPTELGSLRKLIGLSLLGNNLVGGIPPSLGNLSSLTSLVLSINNLGGQIPDSLGRLTSLTALSIGEDNLSGKIPPSIFNISSITVIYMATNNLSGSFPTNMNLPNLQILQAFYNKLKGSIPASLFNASGLEMVVLHGNRFTGPVPSNLGGLRSLTSLTISLNKLEAKEARDWDFVTFLTNCSNLGTLDLSNNRLGGVLPNSVANLSTRLTWLGIGGNQISGSIPMGIGRLTGLTVLNMYRNLLTGDIPDDIGKLSNLHVLDLAGNRFLGLLSSTLGNLTQLNLLDLSENLLQGSIPSSFSSLQSLGVLNLSNNELNGTIPREVVSLSSLSQYLDLSHNSLTGSLPPEVGSLRNLVIFDVSDNRLVGEIPVALGECKILGYLYMEGNLFQGTIPQSLSNLKGIEKLDLSRNNLSGLIPEFLESFQLLHYLNLSFNNLEGEAPTKGVFGNASVVSVIGNNELCGGNPGLHLRECSLPAFGTDHRSLILKVIISIVGGVLCLLVLCFGCYLKGKFRRKKSLSTLSLDKQFTKISYAELLKATDGFSTSNLIGVGSFSFVYRGTLDFDSKVVAIKVLNLEQRGALRSFKAECEALRNIRHRNLVKIFTACSSVDHKGDDFKALVFEFMPNGSLEKWLHPQQRDNSRNLSLVQRMNIAVDVASALNYLHQHGHMPIVHCDLKPSNVLLDDDMIAHVSDFGLTRFLPKTIYKSSQDPTSSIGIIGSIGYIAPEYGVGGHVSTQGDVYSYGVLLLEMFTGKRPTDDTFQDGLNLHRFVEMAFPERIMDIVDTSLLLEEEGNTTGLEERRQVCLVSIMRIGLLCSKELSIERMEMEDVIREMNAIREIFLQSEVHI